MGQQSYIYDETKLAVLKPVNVKFGNIRYVKCPFDLRLSGLNMITPAVTQVGDGAPEWGNYVCLKERDQKQPSILELVVAVLIYFASVMCAS